MAYSAGEQPQPGKERLEKKIIIMLRVYPSVSYNAKQPIDIKMDLDLPALIMIISTVSVG
jgi:hypothetical protein